MNQGGLGVDETSKKEADAAALSHSGKITDKQLFILICVAAIVISAVALGFFFFGPSGPPRLPTWQCLGCGHKFHHLTERLPLPPIECPECHKIEAVMLSYRKCKKCGTRSVYSRVSLPADYAARYQKAAAEGHPPGDMETSHWPREIQFRLEGEDRWSDWFLSRSPEAQDLRKTVKCPKCGESLYPKRQ